MFETTVVESRVGHTSSTRALTLPVSLGLHAVAISGALLAGAWSVTMPETSPPQFAQLFVQTLPSVPAPVEVRREPEPPPEPAQTEPAESSAPAAAPAVDAPPTEIPNSIPVLEPGRDVGLRPDSPVQWGPGSDTAPTGPAGGDGIVQSGPHVVGFGGATRPEITLRVEPVYPPLLMRARMNGSATVECIVEDDGTITSARVTKTTHELFGVAAREAVLNWRFEPGHLNGKPVATIFELTVNFQIRR